MGGTGASTGLMPAFTLGCGTWGGSSTSENVTPMHLVNIKRVAYGLKDCATLAADDPTFNHPTTCGSVVAPVACGGCGGSTGAFSPAQYAAMGAALNAGACLDTPSAVPQEREITQEDLMDLVNHLVSAMKGE